MKMSKGFRQRLSRFSPKTAAAFALVALLAFALGALVFPSREHRAPGPAPTKEDAHAQHGAKSPDKAIWTCAMHPQIRQSQPGQCPICGMDLIPVESSNDEGARADRITLSERAKALARLRTTEVRRMADPRTELRLLGRVEADETRARTVTAWMGGRIDRLHVKVTGQRVGSGQTVATLYSPEVLAAHQDLIAGRRQVERMQAATPTGRSAAEAALEAARDRLRLLGVPEDRVRSMESEDRPTRQIAIRSPFAGTVIERMATEGAYVTTGEPLFRIADLSTVWVQLDAYERDLSTLQVGQVVEVNVEALSGEAFEGKVAFIDPIVDSQQRTARVRVEVANREGRLKPGMFAQAVVQGESGTRAERPLVVPRTAPLFTGRRAIVYVEVPLAERPTYEARVVRLAPRTGEFYPVVAGLVEGERVVMRGAFVLDADLQIRGGTSMMVGPDDTDEGPWDQAIEISSSERRKLRSVLDAYLTLQDALSRDDLSAAKKAGESLGKHAAEVRIGKPQAASEAWAALARELGQHSLHVARADSLENVRGGFEALSAQVQTLLRRFGNPLDRPVSTAFCPMASGHGASWIQEGMQVENPYFGHSMRGCGEILESLPPGAYLAEPVAPRRPPPAAPEGHQH
jgi:membrane fusion protein, copper/silver efflux system